MSTEGKESVEERVGGGGVLGEIHEKESGGSLRLEREGGGERERSGPFNRRQMQHM